MSKQLNKYCAVAVAAGLVTLGLVVIFVMRPARPAVKHSSIEGAVQITKDGFMPATLRVKPGTKVVWTNQDAAPHRVASSPHPTHTDLKDLDSQKPISSGSTYSFSFDQPGTYRYHDHLNPTVNGVIVVE
ncbi:MAG TPA: cupredoxin domain-containing protein [Candidatus Saccharimonadales bacterium]|nr:cupredoxin domain-containing protein [Candidatus Saccharimonadales bacterium]